VEELGVQRSLALDPERVPHSWVVELEGEQEVLHSLKQGLAEVPHSLQEELVELEGLHSLELVEKEHRRESDLVELRSWMTALEQERSLSEEAGQVVEVHS